MALTSAVFVSHFVFSRPKLTRFHSNFCFFLDVESHFDVLTCTRNLVMFRCVEIVGATGVCFCESFSPAERRCGDNSQTAWIPHPNVWRRHQ